MSTFTLRSAVFSQTTVLQNTFIDQYMPGANGEFVKVYIYLLRILGDPSVSFSTEEMADRLMCTERDILRALKYWDKQGLLSLEYAGTRKISGITLTSPGAEENAVSSETAEPAETEALTIQDEPEKPALTLDPSRISELKENEEIVQLLYIAEQYLGKTLSPTEIEKILYFYDSLGMSADLIEYLIEYCVGRSHKSIRYIETVALGWHREGIKTVAEAKKSASGYQKDYFTILKFMGITNRNPVETEVKIMDTWIKTYGFSMEIIHEACSRTVLQTGQASFQYADRILEGWKKKEVQGLKDIQVLDTEHKKSRRAPRPGKTSASNNRFNNFQQREYDFQEYEKRLLNQ